MNFFLCQSFPDLMQGIFLSKELDLSLAKGRVFAIRAIF